METGSVGDMSTPGQEESPDAAAESVPRIVKIAPGPEGRYWKDCLAGGHRGDGGHTVTGTRLPLPEVNEIAE